MSNMEMPQAAQIEAAKDESEKAFKPIESQEELNAILSKRLERERAKFADYSELQKKAAEYDAAREAEKSELEKAQERAAKAEAAAARLQAEALRAEVAAAAGLPPALLHSTSEEALKAEAAALIEWRDKVTRPAPKATGSPHIGKPAPAGDIDTQKAVFVRQLFNREN